MAARVLLTPPADGLFIGAMATRPSQRPFNVSYYARNRAQEIERVRLRQDATIEFLRDLRRIPCADCAGTFEPHQMDFDHRDPTTKSFAVMTGRAMLMSRVRLLEEIAKCDVVCAHCHAIAPPDRRQNAARASVGPAPNRPAQLRRDVMLSSDT